jgi:DNA repair ATPase RecN
MSSELEKARQNVQKLKQAEREYSQAVDNLRPYLQHIQNALQANQVEFKPEDSCKDQ